MQITRFWLVSIVCVAMVAAELQGPPADTSKSEKKESSESGQTSSGNERKSTAETNENIVDEQGDLDESIDENSLASLLAEEFALQGSAIKIIKSPDLSQDSEAQKVTEMLSTLVNSHAKLIKKLEDEIEEIDGSLASLQNADEPEPAALTPEQIELENLYESAMKMLNKTRSDKAGGFALLKQAADKGHLNARAKIAWAQLMGNPIDMNFEEAKNTFLQLADAGLPDAHMVSRFILKPILLKLIAVVWIFQGLGFMYAAGIGFNVSQAKALVHYTFAALGDNTWAQMALGYRYWSGISVASSCEKALEFYCKVATKVMGDCFNVYYFSYIILTLLINSISQVASQITFSGGAAVHRVRLLDEVETSGLSSAIFDNDLLEYYQLLAGKGDVQAQVGLGQLHYQGGRGIALDHQKALQYFTQAANAGNAVAMAFLGKIYLEGSENIKADNETALKYFKKAADLGNPVGQSGLGIMYLQGKGVPKDTAKALNYFTQAADQGWVDGQLQLGNMYFSKLL